MPLIFLLVFIGVPLIELYILIQVGTVIGALPTILLCILTAIIGAALIRLQGLQTMLRARRNLERGETPALEMFEGVGLALAGIMLLTPGFATDILGFALLVPPLRRKMILTILKRMHVVQAPGRPGAHGDGEGPRIIEGDWHQKDRDRHR